MPLNHAAQLNKKLFTKDIEQRPTRDGFGEGLVQAGERDERVVALCADLTESTRVEPFSKMFPERFVEVGVAEQNLATVASGLAAVGKIPFMASYATFSPGRNWEQIRTTICYNNVPVKIVGSHAGVSVGPDGATHQALEDIALTRVLPNMTVIVPCDAEEARKATLAAAVLPGPVYIRLTRDKTPTITTKESPFYVGRAEILWDSIDKRPSFVNAKDRLSSIIDVALVACGPLVYRALEAAAELESRGRKVRVINVHTIKPLDVRTITQAAEDAGAVVTIEEHQAAGGLGGAVAECLAERYPVPIEFIGVQDHFGESGAPEELIRQFQLDTPSIIAATERAIHRKKRK